MTNQNIAAQFTAAIRELARKPENLANLEAYLAHNFEVWLRLYANTPAALAAEMTAFATMEI